MMITTGWRRLLLATTALALGFSGAAQAASLPSGGAVASGSASIGTGVNVLTVNQSSAKAILTWTDFSIGAGNTVQFNNGSGATLNRVVGNGASQIDGSLLATGSVYLINLNGIVIGRGGVVNTGGTFVASSLDYSAANFLAGGALTFSGTSAASVINLGQIGSTGGDVVLAAQTVESDGAITASAGDVGLLAGSKVTLSDTLASNGKFSVALGASSSATNTGQITAAVAELRAYGGNVYALAGNGGGAITATGATTNRGQVFLTAAAPSGATGVGDITITGGVNVSGGANALTIDAFHNAQILTSISTHGGHVVLTANDGGVGGGYSFGLGGGGFSGGLRFTGGGASGEGLTIDGLSYGLIYSASDFAAINANLSHAYALADDIDLSGVAYAQAPIAANGAVFSGKLDGLGHTVRGLTINSSASDIGLIGTLSGSVSNLGVDAAAIIGADNVGALAGSSSGLVSQTYAAGAVGSSAYGAELGGLIGQESGGSVSQSYASDTVTAGYSTTGVGGLIGQASAAATVSQSYAAGAVTAGGTYSGPSPGSGLALTQIGVGGLVGLNAGAISGSYASGAVTAGAQTDSVGGLVGANSGAIVNSYATGAVDGVSSLAVGGLVGGQFAGSVTNSYAAGAVSGQSDVGGLVGYNLGAISQSYSSSAVDSEAGLDYAGNGPVLGGLAGFNSGAISQSYATGTVSAVTPAGAHAQQEDMGGLVGVDSGAITQSYATGAVTGGDTAWAVGGLVGMLSSGGAITESYAAGAVTVGDHAFVVGGLVGGGYSSSIQQAYATGAVKAGVDVSYIGGLTGLLNATSVNQTYASGHVSAGAGATGVGGLVGYNGASTVTASYWDTQTGGQSTSAGGVGLTTQQFSVPGDFTGFTFTTTPGAAGWVTIGHDGEINAASATRPILASEYSTNIVNGHQLQLMSMNVNGSYKLSSNVDLSEINDPSGIWITTAQFIPIGNLYYQFSGSLDGLGHTITNLKINRSGDQSLYAGLFYYVSSTGVVKNLNLTSVNIIGGGVTNGSSSYLPTGGLVGFNAGTLTSDYVSGSVGVQGSSTIGCNCYIGMLAGENYGKISQSHADGQVSGATVTGGTVDIGGLVGVNLGSIDSAYASATVNDASLNVSTIQVAGGLVGLNNGPISNSYATGDVILPGPNYTSAVVTYAGGLVGENYAYQYTGGGISSSYAKGGVVNGVDAGGLVGGNFGQITGSYAQDAATGAKVGGLVGDNEGQISTSYALGAVTGLGSQEIDFGGLAGVNEGTITDSYAAGAVFCDCSGSGVYNGDGQTFGGGLVGINLSETSYITESYATGSVSTLAGFFGSPSGALGGLVGENYFGTISATYATGRVENSMSDYVSQVQNVNGLVGLNVASTPGQHSSTVLASYFDTQTTGQITGGGGIGLTTAQFAQLRRFAGFNFTTTPGAAGWVIVDQNGTLNNAGGAAGATRPILASEYSTTITNGHQLQLIAMNLGAAYSLANNVSLAISNPSDVWVTAEGFSPLGGSGATTTAFNGVLDGNGHAIDRLSINAAAAGLKNAGLFATVSGEASISGLALTNASVTGTTNLGALAGRIYGPATITDVSVSGAVSGTGSVGGLVGYDNAAAITDASSSASVSGTTQVGGLVGWNSGALSGDSATGAVTASGAGAIALGGLVGVDYGAIDHSWASGAVSGGAGLIIGGLVGDDAGAIATSYAKGAVSGYADIGGLAGRVRGASLNDDYATGSVTGVGTGAYDLGGFAGATDAATALTRVYATGHITGLVFTGGLVGYNSGALTDAYWNVQTSGLYNAVGGVPGPIDATGLYTAQMGHQASYAGWNFTTVWNAPAGGAPPTLR